MQLEAINVYIHPNLKGVLMILFFMVVTLSLVGACEFDSHARDMTPTLAPKPTGVPQTVVPFWRGIIPGKTTSQEVLEQLGMPNTRHRYQDLEAWNYYFGDYGEQSDFCRLIFRSNVVQLVTVGTFNNVIESLEQYLHTLGKAEHEIEFQAGVYRTITYVYAQRGLALTGLGDEVMYKQYFLPISLDEFMASWGRYYPEQIPFRRGVPTRLEDLEVVPGQTTKGQLEKLLGSPDRIGVTTNYGYPTKYQASGKEGLDYFSYLLPWAQGGCPDLTFLFSGDTLVLFACPRDYSAEMRTLGDVVEKFGQPDGYYEEGGVEYRFKVSHIFRRFVFAQKGLTVVSSSTFSGPKSQDSFFGFLFSEPMTLEEYQKVWNGGWFEKPVFVSWKGFNP